MKTPHLKLLLGGLVILATFTPPPPASAELIWQDFSLSLLSGSSYEKQEITNSFGTFQTQAESRTVVTFEHASGHTWGSTFLFIDRLMSRDSDFGNDAMYGELNISPNIAKLGGFVKNIYFAPQWEFGSGDNGADSNLNPGDGNSFNNYLLGFGVGLAVPKASFFNVSLYKRFNDDQTLDNNLPSLDPGNSRIDTPGRTRDDNEQLTVVWRFDFADGRVRFDGFLDAVTGYDIDYKTPSVDAQGNIVKTKDKAVSGYNFTPQLKFDIGRVMGMTPKKLWVGGEWVYWQNKFGVKDWDESNLNFLLKWHF